MNTVLMYVIMGLDCRFKAPGGGFRNLKFDLLYKYIYIYSQGIHFSSVKLRQYSVCMGRNYKPFVFSDTLTIIIKKCRHIIKYIFYKKTKYNLNFLTVSQNPIWSRGVNVAMTFTV